MYERAVISAYILANPDQAEAFLDYDKVNKRTPYMHAKKLGKYGPTLSAETIKRIEDEFQAVTEILDRYGRRQRSVWHRRAEDGAAVAFRDRALQWFWPAVQRVRHEDFCVHFEITRRWR